MKLPIKSKGQITGQEVQLFLEKELSKFFNVVKSGSESDLGIDFYCERIDEKGNPTGKYVAIQCKGTKDELLDRIQIKVSTVNYWRIQPFPVALCLVKLNTNKTLFCFPMDQSATSLSNLENKSYVTIKFDTQKELFLEGNKLNEEFETHLNLSGKTSLLAYTDYIKSLMESFNKPVIIDDLDLMKSDNIPSSQFLKFYKEISKTSLEYGRLIKNKILQLIKKMDYIMMAIEYDCPFFRNPSNSIVDFELSGGITPNIVKKAALDVINKFEINANFDVIVEMIECYTQLCNVNNSLKWCREIHKDTFLE
jgi:hypothetical protein